MSQQAGQGSGHPDAWHSPKKVARRPRRAMASEDVGNSLGTKAGAGCMEGSSGVVHGLGAAGLSGTGEGNLSAPGPLKPVPKKSGRRAVPFSEATGMESAVSQHPGTPVTSVISANPFAVLGSDSSAGRPQSRKEANPGPLKRARPIESIESLAPRVASGNRKGKGKQLGKRSVQFPLNSPVPVAESNGSETFRGFVSMTKPTEEVRNLDVPSDALQMMQEEDLSHDHVVSMLKQAIQPKGTADDMDTLDQCPLEGVTPATCPPGTVLLGDVMGPLPSE